MRRWVFLSILFAALMVFDAHGEDLGACDDASVSKKVERQAQKWEQQSRRYGKAASVAEKIDKRLAKGDLEACDIKRLERALLRVKSRSLDSSEAILALEQLIDAGERGVEGEPTVFIRSLGGYYLSKGQVEKLVAFATDHLEEVAGNDRSQLMNALVIGLAATGDVEGAYVIAVDRIREFPKALSLNSTQLLYAMAGRLGYADHQLQYAEFSDQNFEGLHTIGSLPLFEGDDLARVLERRTNPIYELKLKVLPKPNYPSYAANKRLNGMCEVYFDVSEDGRPVNVQPLCSHEAFIEESIKAVRKMRYEPFEVDGVRYSVPAFVYPLEYTIG